MFTRSISFFALITVIIFSAILASQAYALTDEEIYKLLEAENNKELKLVEEKGLPELCRKYEEWFDYHTKHYNVTLAFYSQHIKFTYNRVPQKYISNGPSPLVFAEISQKGNAYLSLEVTSSWVHIEGNSGTDGEYKCGIPYALLDKERSAHKDCSVWFSVSDQSPNAGALRQFGGAILDFLGEATNVDQGKFIVCRIRDADEGRNGTYIFRATCSECAELLVKFLNDLVRTMK